MHLSATEQAAQSHEQYSHPPQVGSSVIFVNNSLCANICTMPRTPLSRTKSRSGVLAIHLSGGGRSVCSPRVRGVWFAHEPGVRSSRLEVRNSLHFASPVPQNRLVYMERLAGQNQCSRCHIRRDEKGWLRKIAPQKC